jgi:Flp pilus assembly protein TadG
MSNMPRTKEMPGHSHNDERGVVILLVAVFMLFVMGAMAALSIDVATLYTARSEAQLAADGAALAGARVLANSGATSTSDTTAMASAWTRARAIAFQVAEQNLVGGANLTAAEVTISDVPAGTNANPIFTVRVQKNDLPTFFARIWGKTQLTVAASATAEAYNPSILPGTSASPKNQVAPMCVKPWLLPNIDPSNATPGSTIFDPGLGTINAGSNLLGWSSIPPGTGSPITPRCLAGDCTGPPTPTVWKYYPGDDVTFPPPTHSIPTCVPVDPYQESLAGCIDTPISCNARVNIDPTNQPVRDADTTNAINCLTHATTNPLDADQVDLASPVGPPFQFIAGTNNPLALANPSLVGQDVMVSSSLVTVPVFDVGSGTTPPVNPVQVVGFVQLFLNPDGLATPVPGSVNATVINLVGCGTAANIPQILGNGASPVVVRLISPGP